MKKQMASVSEAKRAKARPTPPAGEIIFLVEEAPEGGWTARALGAAIFTEAETVATLRRRVREAVDCHFGAGRKPKIIRLHFVREEVIAA